jgi:hypothetical protein
VASSSVVKKGDLRAKLTGDLMAKQMDELSDLSLDGLRVDLMAAN